jgi:putative glutamine amidotransferase
VHHHGLMTRPLIGITSEMAAAGWDGRVREAVLLPASYALALERSGCAPVLLPSASYLHPGLASALGGLVFSDRARGAADVALMRSAIRAGLPLLAIGRAMLALNAARGGSLTRPDDDGPAPGPVTWTDRNVRLSPDSRLGRLLGPSLTAPFESVPSGRDEAVDRLGTGVSAVAWADAESIEAIELAGHPFALGMRWHPERGEDLRVFEGLRAAADSRSAAA